MKVRRLTTVFLAVIFMLSLTQNAFAAPVPETPPGGPEAGTLSIWSNSDVAPALQSLADDLWAGHQILLTVEAHASLREDFIAAVAAGTAPDLIALSHDQLGSLVNMGLMAPLDLNGQDAQFLSSAVEASTFNGQLYGVPWAVESLGFFYNTDLVPTPPTTWDQVRSIGESLQASNQVQYGMSVSGTTYDLYPLFTAFGGYIFGQDAAGNWDTQDLGVDSPGMIAGLQWLVDRRTSGFISANTDWNNAHTLFETGQTPFIMSGPWALDRIHSSGVHYAITDFPSQTQAGTPFMGALVVGANAASGNTTNIEIFLNEYLITEPIMTALSQAVERAPAYLPSIANLTDPDLLAFAQIAENASPMPAIPEMGSVWGNWNDAVTSALQGTLTAEEALTEAAARIRALIGGNLDGMVNVPGSYQTQAGCSADWRPDCVTTAMTKVDDIHWVSGPFRLDAGDYECKVALDGSWAINYGVGGIQDGDNYGFTLPTSARVIFTWDEQTHLLSIDPLPPSKLYLPLIIKAAPPSNEIVFMSNRDGNLELYSMKADGSNVKRLTNTLELNEVSPVWSPDGSKIAYVTADASYNRKIYVMNQDGTGVTYLTDGYDPDWSPDGTKLVFATLRDGNAEIYTISANGSNPQRITNEPQSDSMPAWSPDGSKIVFHSERFYVNDAIFPGLFQMDPTGANVTSLIAALWTENPDWCSNGTKLTFEDSEHVDGNPLLVREIYVHYFSGSGVGKLTNPPDENYDASWSPDCSKIIFTTYRDGNAEMYTMNADGTSQVRITNNSFYDGQPNWK